MDSLKWKLKIQNFLNFENKMLVHKILKKVRRTGFFPWKRSKFSKKFVKILNFLKFENKLFIHKILKKVRRTGFFLEIGQNFCKNSKLLKFWKKVVSSQHFEKSLSHRLFGACKSWSKMKQIQRIPWNENQKFKTS